MRLIHFTTRRICLIKHDEIVFETFFKTYQILGLAITKLQLCSWDWSQSTIYARAWSFSMTFYCQLQWGVASNLMTNIFIKIVIWYPLKLSETKSFLEIIMKLEGLLGFSVAIKRNIGQKCNKYSIYLLYSWHVYVCKIPCMR